MALNGTYSQISVNFTFSFARPLCTNFQIPYSTFISFLIMLTLINLFILIIHPQPIYCQHFASQTPYDYSFSITTRNKCPWRLGKMVLLLRSVHITYFFLKKTPYVPTSSDGCSNHHKLTLSRNPKRLRFDIKL